MASRGQEEKGPNERGIDYFVLNRKLKMGRSVDLMVER